VPVKPAAMAATLLVGAGTPAGLAALCASAVPEIDPPKTSAAAAAAPRNLLRIRTVLHPFRHYDIQLAILP